MVCAINDFYRILRWLVHCDLHVTKDCDALAVCSTDARSEHVLIQYDISLIWVDLAGHVVYIMYSADERNYAYILYTLNM